jgi:hypothetical protein
MERGRDENLEKGARYKRQPSYHQHSRVFLVKILQHDFLHRRSSRYWNINLQSNEHYSTNAAHGATILIFKANEHYSTNAAHGAKILIFKLFKKPKPDKHSPAHVHHARR